MESKSAPLASPCAGRAAPQRLSVCGRGAGGAGGPSGSALQSHGAVVEERVPRWPARVTPCPVAEVLRCHTH